MLRSRWAKIAIAAFVAFYLFTRPAQAGHAVQSAIGGVQTGAGQMATFVSTVLK